MRHLARLSPLCLVSAGFACAAVPACGAPEDVGRASAVNPASSGTPPGRSTRTLEIGSNVVFKERITTSAGGNLQLLFVDKTTLAVGPNSNLIIDEFVYDPGSGTGRSALTMLRGAVRFVGGNTSHTGGATIATPVATIGIRGGVAMVRYDDRSGKLEATNVFGVMTITNAAGSETIRRPGFTVTVAGAGSPPSPPVRVTLAQVDADRAAVTSQGSQRGGAPTQPTDQGAVRRGVEAVNLGTGPTTLGLQRQAVATAAGPNTSTTANAVTQTSQNSLSSPLVVNAGSQRTNAAVAVQFAARTEAFDPPTSTAPAPTATPSASPAPSPAPSSASPVPSPEPPVAQGPAPSPVPSPPPSATPPASTPPVPPPGARAFLLTTNIDPGLGSTVPFVLGAAVASGPVYVSPVYGYRAASPDGVNPGPTRTLNVAFGVNGSGASQSSNFMVATARNVTLQDGTTTLAGGFNFAGRRAASLTMSRASGSVTGVPGTYLRESDGTPHAITVNQDFYTGSAIVPDTAFERPGGGGAGQNYTYSQDFSPSSPPPGLGGRRQTGTFTGFAAGMVRTLDNATQNNIAEFAQPIVGTSTLRTDAATSRAEVRLNLNATTTTGRPTGALTSATLQMGSIDQNLNPRSTYIDDATIGAREAVTATSTTGQSPISTVNGVVLINEHSLTATAAATNVQSFFPNVTFCACEYARWGFWSDETARTGYSDRIHLGTWVAGPASAATDLPTTGTATYTGHAIASIRDSNNEYVAASNMTNTVNFGTRLIASSVPSLDGRAYAGTLSIPTGTAGISGTLSSTGGAAMSINGGFFGSVPGAAPMEMGGSLVISGGTAAPNYAGAGTFAARR